VRVYRPLAGAKPMYVFDWMSTQTCASDSPLVLPKYHYGGLGYRGSRQWEDKSNCFFLTNEGKDRSNGNETTGRWCWVGGKVDGQMAGVAILCHPDNFRFPQPMRLNPDEPFFCFAPSQGGEWRIEPGKPYVARYRFVVADGGADATEIERLWNDYAHPPTVTVK
jgi:methane monooxygenase PmoA-like